MKNKKKVEAAIFGIAIHMSQCPVCIEALCVADVSKAKSADPACPEYQRLKKAAKTLAESGA